MLATALAISTGHIYNTKNQQVLADKFAMHELKTPISVAMQATRIYMRAWIKKKSSQKFFSYVVADCFLMTEKHSLINRKKALKKATK